jgi:hypothetical protein
MPPPLTPPPVPGGGIDIWGLIVTLFSRQNAREGVKLLASGLAIEGGRRMFTWLSDRVLPRTPCSRATSYLRERRG